MPILRFALLLALAAGPILAADSAAEMKAHIKAAQTHYQIGEFDAAIKEFREAYKLKQDPGLLFNIATCARQLHDYQQAYFHYRQYLAQRPDAANRKEVEALIDQMKHKAEEEEARAAHASAAAPKPADPPKSANAPEVRPEPAAAKAQPTAARAPAAAEKVPAAAVTASAPQVAEASHPARIAGYVALGLGVAAEGAAFIFHSSAQSAADQFNQK